jgi:hypothetical protein
VSARTDSGEQGGISAVRAYIRLKAQQRTSFACDNRHNSTRLHTVPKTILNIKRLSNCSASRSIFGYSYPAPASCPASLHLAWGLRLPRRCLHSRTRLPQRLSVLRLIWPAHCHFSMLIRCAMSVTLVLCRITWFRIRIPQRNPELSSFHSSLSDLELVAYIQQWTVVGRWWWCWCIKGCAGLKLLWVTRWALDIILF